MNPTMEVVAVAHPDKALLRSGAPALAAVEPQPLPVHLVDDERSRP